MKVLKKILNATCHFKLIESFNALFGQLFGKYQGKHFYGSAIHPVLCMFSKVGGTLSIFGAILSTMVIFA